MPNRVRRGDIEENVGVEQNLPAPQVEELASWLEQLRARRTPTPLFEIWLERARGAAVPGVTKDDVMTLTRGEK